MENTQHIPLVIERLPEGGFTVSDYGFHSNEFSARLMACADIGDALNFIRSRLWSPSQPVSAFNSLRCRFCPTGQSDGVCCSNTTRPT